MFLGAPRKRDKCFIADARTTALPRPGSAVAWPPSRLPSALGMRRVRSTPPPPTAEPGLWGCVGGCLGCDDVPCDQGSRGFARSRLCRTTTGPSVERNGLIARSSTLLEASSVVRWPKSGRFHAVNLLYPRRGDVSSARRRAGDLPRNLEVSLLLSFPIEHLKDSFPGLLDTEVDARRAVLVSRRRRTVVLFPRSESPEKRPRSSSAQIRLTSLLKCRAGKFRNARSWARKRLLGHELARRINAIPGFDIAAAVLKPALSVFALFTVSRRFELWPAPATLFSKRPLALLEGWSWREMLERSKTPTIFFFFTSI